MSRCWRPLCRSLLLAGLVLVCLAPVLAQEEINWLEDWPSAQAAARKSGRRVLAYIYEHNHAACVQMDRSTFSDPGVIKALNERFTLLAINGSSSRNRSFLQAHGVGVRSGTDKGWTTDFAAIPAYLLLDAEGQEYYHSFGFYPALLFLNFLDQLTRLADLRDTITRNPGDAAAQGNLGRLYLELERPELGKPYLQKAVDLDFDDRLGARSEAELDLAILGIPDDPEAAFGKLVTYRFAHTTSPRNLEVQYYMAVAQLAAKHYDRSEKILMDFASIPPKRPDGSDNPDYRNPWVLRAELLLRQLRDVLKTPNTAPKP